MKKKLQNLYLLLIVIFLYAPIMTLMVLSFNSSRTRAKWGGFTGKWYVSLFQDEAIMSTLYNTLIIALLSALIATVIGTLASIGIQSMNRKFRTFMLGVTNIPMLNADIVTGVSMMLLFIAFRMTMGFTTILIAHITFNIPYVILSVMPKLKQTNRRTYEAALDLGASPIYAFFKVVFPDILPGILSGFLLAFTMSLDDFVITHFTKGPGIDTLSGNLRTLNDHVCNGALPSLPGQFKTGKRSSRKRRHDPQAIPCTPHDASRRNTCRTGTARDRHYSRRIFLQFKDKDFRRRKGNCLQLGRISGPGCPGYL